MHQSNVSIKGLKHKLSSLLLCPVALVACMAVTTSCEEGEDLTKEDAVAAFRNSAEKMTKLEADIAGDQVVKVIDKLVAGKLDGALPHFAPAHYLDFFYYWNDKTAMEAGKAYKMDASGTLTEEGSAAENASSVTFAVESNDATVTFTDQTTTPLISAHTSISYGGNQILSEVLCSGETKDAGTYSFTLTNGIMLSYAASDGVSVDVGGGISIKLDGGEDNKVTGRTFAITTDSKKKAIYSYTEGNAAGHDLTEIIWGEIWLHLDGIGVGNVSTNVEIKAIRDTKRHDIGKLDAKTGAITYVDGQTGKADVDMPELYAHLKDLFKF